MTEWPWLMIILALVSMVQWPNSTAQPTKDNNSYREGYLRSSASNRSEITRFFHQDTTATTAITSSYNEKQTDEPVINIKNIKVTDLPPANLKKSLFTNENTTNNTNKQPSNIRNKSKNEMTPIVFPSITSEQQSVPINKFIPYEQQSVPIKKFIPYEQQPVPINKFIPDPQVIKKCALNQTFCIKVDNYPIQDLSNIFRTSKYKSSFLFGTDIIPDEIATRSSFNNLDTFCQSKEVVIYPQAGVTKNNQWRFILQDLNIDDSNLKQGVVVEECINVDKKCKFDGNMPTGYKTICKQKFIYRKLMALKDSQEIYYEHFQLPSCCECMIINPDLSTSINQELLETSKTN